MARGAGHLSDADVKQILDFVYLAGEVDGLEPFDEASLEALYGLVSPDLGACCVEFSEERPGTDPETRSVLAFAEVQCEWCVGVQAYWTDELDEICRAYVEEQEPIPPWPQYMNRALRISEVMKRRQQQPRELWHDVARPGGQADGLWLWMQIPGDPVLRRIGLATSKRGGITDRDVLVVDLLAPHLARIHSRAAERRRTAMRSDGLTPREREILRLVAEGWTNREVARTLWISPNTVRTHLENVFEKLEVKTRAAAVARVFSTPFENGGNGAPPLLAVEPGPLVPGATNIRKYQL
jgi:DNA-binding CsgD family transcriptional regulator